MDGMRSAGVILVHLGAYFLDGEAVGDLEIEAAVNLHLRR